MIDGRPRGDPPAQRFPGQMETPGAYRVSERHHVINVMRHLQRMAGFVGVAVSEHVDRPGVEVAGVGSQIAHIGFGVSTRPMQQDQRRLVAITGMQIAGPDAPRVQVALRECDTLQITPNTVELRHQIPFCLRLRHSLLS